jgi:hypothetical protein
VHCRAFAQEFGVDAHAEFIARALAGISLEQRDDDAAHRAGQHRATEHDHRRARVVGERLADLLADALHVPEIDAAIGLARRADADEHEVGVPHGVFHHGSGVQPARGDLLGDDLAQVLLDDRRATLIDQVDLGALRIDTDDFMPFLRQ